MVSRGQRLVLSIRQPYAELILCGEKTIEYRSRPTRIRERVYIYASLGPGAISDFEALGASPASLPAGQIVGSVAIVGCERHGRTYHWLLAEPRRLARPRRPRQHAQPVWFHPW